MTKHDTGVELEPEMIPEPELTKQETILMSRYFKTVLRVTEAILMGGTMQDKNLNPYQVSNTAITITDNLIKKLGEKL